MTTHPGPPDSHDEIGPAPAPSRRVIRARRGLPSGRASVGALLVTLAAVGAFALADRSEGEPQTRYVVVADNVDAGEAIDAADLTTAAMTLAPDVEAVAEQEITSLEGATALRTLRAGTLLDRRDLRIAAVVDGEPVAGVHELTLPVPRDRAPGELRLGDRVTLLAFDDGVGELRTALEDALVLDYTVETAGIGSSDEARLTLAVPDAERVLTATRWSYAPLTVVLSSRAIDDRFGERYTPETPGDLEATDDPDAAMSPAAAEAPT